MRPWICIIPSSWWRLWVAKNSVLMKEKMHLQLRSSFLPHTVQVVSDSTAEQQKSHLAEENWLLLVTVKKNKIKN